MTIKFTNINEFNRDLKKVMKSVKAEPVLILEKVTFDGLRGMQRRTPEDTARAAGGWNVSIGKPSEWKPSKGQGSYPKQQANLASLKLGQQINISNNVEYIVPLDEGHSKRASTGIVNYVLTRMQTMILSLTKKESNRVIK